jgi:hypothetical protein
MSSEFAEIADKQGMTCASVPRGACAYTTVVRDAHRVANTCERYFLFFFYFGLNI